MKEELLQYLWQHKIFMQNELKTTDGRDIHIISPGMMHHDAGPDFKQAVIRINDIIWAGDVEIHVNGSDWYRHHHQNDEKYKSVILHVVYNADMEIVRQDKEYIPTLELKNYISEEMLEEYKKLTLPLTMYPAGTALPLFHHSLSHPSSRPLPLTDYCGGRSSCFDCSKNVPMIGVN